MLWDLALILLLFIYRVFLGVSPRESSQIDVQPRRRGSPENRGSQARNRGTGGEPPIGFPL